MALKVARLHKWRGSPSPNPHTKAQRLFYHESKSSKLPSFKLEAQKSPILYWSQGDKHNQQKDTSESYIRLDRIDEERVLGLSL